MKDESTRKPMDDPRDQRARSNPARTLSLRDLRGRTELPTQQPPPRRRSRRPGRGLADLLALLLESTGNWPAKDADEFRSHLRALLAERWALPGGEEARAS